MLGKNNKNDRRRRSYNIKNNGIIRKFDTRQRNQYVNRRVEVYGIVIVMISVLFFLSFFSFGRTGIITNYANDYLSYLFGITKYIIALLLFIWGISFFLKRIKYLPSRFGWGFFLVYVCSAGLLSPNFNYTNIFDSVLVRSRGGIIGAGIFYGLFKLVSKAGAVTILAVIFIIGILIVTRVSIIDIFRRISARASGKKPVRDETAMNIETNISD